MRIWWFLFSALLVGCDSSGGVSSDASTHDSGVDAAPDCEDCPAIPPLPATQTCRPAPVDFDRIPDLILPPAFAGVELIGAVDVVQPAIDGALWVAESAGRIRRVEVGPSAGVPTLVLDLTGRGRRFVSLAMRPEYDDGGDLFLLSYIEGHLVVSRFQIYQGIAQVDALSEERMFEVEAPEGSTGSLQFGLDGLLYIALGGEQPPWGGTLLRIDVNIDEPGWQVPPDNPDPTSPIWSRGLHNPSRCSVDGNTEQVICLDRGDEADTIHIAGPGDDLAAKPPLVTRPVDDCHLIGGFTYRGFKWPELWGTYLYATSCGEIRGIKQTEGGPNDRAVGQLDRPILFMTQDPWGRIRVVGDDGRLARLTVAEPDTELGWPRLLSQTDCFESLQPLTPKAGVVPYALNSPLWTDGALKQRFMVIPSGTQITATDAGWDYPDGSVLIKDFAFEFTPGDSSSRRSVETRFMVKYQFGWTFHTYRWNDEGTDATLLDGLEPVYRDLLGPTGAIPMPYLFPSQEGCLTCHNPRAERVLGPRTIQLDRQVDYGHVTMNQLDALEQVGVLQPVVDRHSMPDPKDESKPIEQRARAYLHANCAHCHQPTGWAPPGLGLDLRYSTPLAQTGTCNVEPKYATFLVPGELRIDPGRPQNSNLLQRMLVRTPGQMPLFASSLVDPLVDQLIGQWIEQMPECP